MIGFPVPTARDEGACLHLFVDRGGHNRPVEGKVFQDVVDRLQSEFNRLRRVPPGTMEKAILQAANSPRRSPAKTWLV